MLVCLAIWLAMAAAGLTADQAARLNVPWAVHNLAAVSLGNIIGGGVDARGDLTVSNLGPIKIFVQAKRYQLGSKVRANDVRKLRQSIPNDGQGAFITTADYQAKTTDVALETGFSRIGLINGHQLVDLLIEHWGSVPQGFQERPGLKTRIGTPMTILTGGHTEKAVLAGLRRSGRTGAAWD